ncbi:MAG: hypothetical protein KatS3mg129_2509 [Leptospiraceae bacterium]|nr:MAG: hypothetical protein KatS3mg129_2509 [Leptospiraceae bacterium]
MKIKLLQFTIIFYMLINSLFSQEKIIITSNKKIYNALSNSYIFYDTEKNFQFVQIQEFLFNKSKFYRYFSLMKSHLIGFYKGRLWIYVSLYNNKKQSIKLYLLIAPWHIDKINVYEIYNKQIKIVNLGDHYPFSKRNIKSNEFFYSLELMPEEEKILLLEIESTSSIQLPLTLFQEDSFITYIRNNQLIYGIYIGMIAIMCLFNLFLYFSIKDRIYLYYVSFLFFLGLTILSITGYAYEYIWGNYPYFAQIANYILENLTIIFAYLFMIVFLDIKKINKKLYYLGIGIISYLLISKILIFINNILLINKMVLINLLISSFVMIIITIYGTFKKSPYAKILLISWFILILSIIIRILMDFSQLQLDYHYSNWAILVGSALDMSLISLGLGYRFNSYMIKSKEYDMEIQFAKDIQKFILPDYPFIKLKNYLTYLHIPPRGLGGDLNCFYVIKNHIVIIQIDVSGHNIGTAVISALVKGYIEQIIQSFREKDQIKELPEYIINHIYGFIKHRAESHHLSMVISLIDLFNKQTIIARCGHPYPILISKDKKFKILETSGSIIHPKLFIEPEIKTFPISDGDTLYFYSDGLFELDIFKNKDKINEIEICEYLLRINHLLLNEIIKDIYIKYKNIYNKIHLDDISIIIFRYDEALLKIIQEEIDIIKDTL